MTPEQGLAVVGKGFAAESPTRHSRFGDGALPDPAGRRRPRLHGL